MRVAPTELEGTSTEHEHWVEDMASIGSYWGLAMRVSDYRLAMLGLELRVVADSERGLADSRNGLVRLV